MFCARQNNENKTISAREAQEAVNLWRLPSTLTLNNRQQASLKQLSSTEYRASRVENYIYEVNFELLLHFSLISTSFDDCVHMSFSNNDPKRGVKVIFPIMNKVCGKKGEHAINNDDWTNEMLPLSKVIVVKLMCVYKYHEVSKKSKSLLHSGIIIQVLFVTWGAKQTNN